MKQIREWVGYRLFDLAWWVLPLGSLMEALDSPPPTGLVKPLRVETRYVYCSDPTCSAHQAEWAGAPSLSDTRTGAAK